jgi:hypothetical protein
MDKDAVITPQLQKIVDVAACNLGEHFSSVRIFVTLQGDDERETGSYTTGKGDFYAQKGNIDEWRTFMDESERHYARTQLNKPEDDTPE